MGDVDEEFDKLFAETSQENLLGVNARQRPRSTARPPSQHFLKTNILGKNENQESDNDSTSSEESESEDTKPSNNNIDQESLRGKQLLKPVIPNATEKQTPLEKPNWLQELLQKKKRARLSMPDIEEQLRKKKQEEKEDENPWGREVKIVLEKRKAAIDNTVLIIDNSPTKVKQFSFESNTRTETSSAEKTNVKNKTIKDTPAQVQDNIEYKNATKNIENVLKTNSNKSHTDSPQEKKNKIDFSKYFLNSTENNETEKSSNQNVIVQSEPEEDETFSSKISESSFLKNREEPEKPQHKTKPPNRQIIVQSEPDKLAVSKNKENVRTEEEKPQPIKDFEVPSRQETEKSQHKSKPPNHQIIIQTEFKDENEKQGTYNTPKEKIIPEIQFEKEEVTKVRKSVSSDSDDLDDSDTSTESVDVYKDLQDMAISFKEDIKQRDIKIRKIFKKLQLMVDERNSKVANFMQKIKNEISKVS